LYFVHLLTYLSGLTGANVTMATVSPVKRDSDVTAM
jgi:hypothetical protein